MKTVDLVFRTVGERTSAIALDLAIQHIQPQKVHIIENIKPFSQAVRQMLAIDYDCDYIVFVDADCLIWEDMQPFLQRNSFVSVEGYVVDKFRGSIPQGIHITHIDLIHAMQSLEIVDDDKQYVLRPETRLQDRALEHLHTTKHFHHFRVLHDWFQSYENLFAKYALTELRSRTPIHRAKLNAAEMQWKNHLHDPDFLVVQTAVNYARTHVLETASPHTIGQFIAALPTLAAEEIPHLSLPVQPPLTIETVELQAKQQWQRSLHPLSHQPDRWHHPKVFGIGLSRTGTKSLTHALHQLGIHTIHYPDDETTLRELAAGNYKFSLLRKLDGITDITVSAFYPQLDRLFPGSQFILTVRDKESWLESLEKHWQGRPAFCHSPSISAQDEVHMHIRRFLRAAVYGCYEFNRDRLSYVYDTHYHNVLNYFRDRPESLLVLDICGGEGWQKLCSFLGKPLMQQSFPIVQEEEVLKLLLH